MNKPAFNDLPWSVQEYYWHEIDELDYDSYDSSREQLIADIRNGNINFWNKQVMERYYANRSVEDILHVVNYFIEQKAFELDSLKKFVATGFNKK
jgi:hypothetical protein